MSDEVKGFKFKRFNYVGGSGSWASSTTKIERSRAVLKDFADWLVGDSGLHWELDTDRNQTTNDFVGIPTTNDSDKYPALFFVNTSSNCKLFMGMFGKDNISGVNINRQFIANNLASSESVFACGLVLSVIANGSDDFGSVPADGALPNDFLPESATLFQSGINGSNNRVNCYISKNVSGVNYAYGLFATDTCIGIGGGYSSNSIPEINIGFFSGKIFGVLAHENDTLPQSKFGSVAFRLSDRGGNGTLEFEYFTDEYFDYQGNRYYGYSFNSYSSSSKQAFGCLSKVDGTWVNNSENFTMCKYPSSIYDTSKYVTNSSITEHIRWVPYTVGIKSNDLSVYGVIPGDGLKGQLDTDLFRCAWCEKNRLYDNKHFIGCENGLMLGWDPSNTESL